MECVSRAATAGHRCGARASIRGPSRRRARLAAWFEVVYPRKSERKVGQAAAQGPALLPLRGARRRRRGLARLAVAKTPWRRGPQPLSSA